jgi:hypothetical protein
VATYYPDCQKCLENSALNDFDDSFSSVSTERNSYSDCDWQRHLPLQFDPLAMSNGETTATSATTSTTTSTTSTLKSICVKKINDLNENHKSAPNNLDIFEKLENGITEHVQNNNVDLGNDIDDVSQQNNLEQTLVPNEIKKPISSIISTFSNLISGIFFKSEVKEKGLIT